MTRPFTLMSLLTVALIFPTRLHADAGPWISSGWYLPVGLNLGAGIHPDLNHGFVLGGEISAAYLSSRNGVWGGLYVDGVWDWGSDTTRVSFGGEVGFAFIGLDMGYLWDIGPGWDHRQGLSLRGLLTISIVTITGRWGHLFSGDPVERDFGEVGILIKFPIFLTEGGRAYRPRRE